MPYLNHQDIFLFIVELLNMIGFSVSLSFALFNYAKHRSTKFPLRGWEIICVGLLLGVIHSFFDLLDTLDWGNDAVIDWLNLFDGAFFVLSIVMFGVGILLTLKWNIAQWGLQNG